MVLRWVRNLLKLALHLVTRRGLDLPRDSMYSISNLPKSVATCVRNGAKSLRLPNYMVTFSAGKTAASTIKAYTPFTAQTGLDWWPVLVRL